jgi:hypothetical protein
MSIFAGIITRSAGVELPESVVQKLRQVVSRSPEDADRRIEFRHDRAFMVKIDIGAFAESGESTNGGATSFVAGEPLLVLNRDAPPGPRSEDLASVAEAVVAGQHHVLRACRGTYCAVVYDTDTDALHLVVDKLGVRPIYYWASPDFVVFSTAMRIIEDLPFCTKTLSLRGVAESACFGFSLADRTAYENVTVLRAGEVVSFRAGHISRQCYWRWDELPPPQDDCPDVETRASAIFRDAVRLRLRNDRTTAAFLSGGLDSRSIVATLRELGANVLSVSFGASGSQDQVFAAIAAEHLGTRHTQIRKTPVVEGDAYSKATLLSWIKSPAYEKTGIERPRLVWGGDGGSVGLGHVYLNEDMVQAMRVGDIQAAIDSFLAHNPLAVETRLLKPAVAVPMQRAIKQGIEEELKSVHPIDAGRSMHLFLMLNDQRRHLVGHFENIDLGRIDFHEPFFDADFLTAILREPIDPFLRHRFYVDWLSRSLPDALGMPWQAYPGHVPCPVPVPDGLSYQWVPDNDEESHQKRRRAIAQAETILASKHFSDKYLQKPYLHVVRLLLQAGMRKREYLLHTPAVLHNYWSKTSE